MKKINVDLNSLGISIVIFSLCAFVMTHAFGLLTSEESQILKYQNIVSKEPIDYMSKNILLAFRLVGLLLLSSGLIFFCSFVKMEFKNFHNPVILKWGILIAIISGMLYGALMRIVGNQQGAALLFFFDMLLYLLLFFIEHYNPKTNTFFRSFMLLPLYLILFYTMGLPGWAKLFGGPMVIERYVKMFKNSFVADLPGGTPLMIYGLGVLEMLVPLFLIISLLKLEFKVSSKKNWLNYAMLTSIFTFGMLCFGLAILYNFAGSVNLVFYPIFTLLVLICINKLTV